ncbi:hypothetical protein L204_103592 [Cryptococcus depauperatus]|nr:dol-P-Man:Man(5)GlcNAc(2)-PP-Dol alpha-1,3-mannosyltransferase [Cryptococcus depauperatus CBS 7855]
MFIATREDEIKGKRGSLKLIVGILKSLLLDRRYFWHLATLLILGEVLLGLLVIWKIPYTKIDWPAYMQQVEMFLQHERNYAYIKGETGPLVYPALHLYIYTAFYKLLPSVEDVRPAQYLFLAIYLLTFLAISTIYYLAGRSHVGARHYPQVLLIPLTLSKRAHSIYVLRLFNDPIAMLFFYLSVIAMQLGEKKGWRLSCVMFSLAMGVKMNILLFLPGLLVLLFQYRGLVGLVESIGLILAIQVALPAPFFLSTLSLALSYFTSAFDFSRQFLYEWTVNWKFISQEAFLSRERAVLLLAGHVTVLALFAAFKWSPTLHGTIRVLSEGLAQPKRPAVNPSQLPAYHIPLVLFTSNLIGMLFARSLHYQFHSWYFHQLPFLLFSGVGWHSNVLSALIWTMIQFAWETAPATKWNSFSLLGGHVFTLIGLFLTPSLYPARKRKAD